MLAHLQTTPENKIVLVHFIPIVALIILLLDGKTTTPVVAI
jgi:hypothetical protein